MICVYCGNEIDLRKKFGIGFSGWLNKLRLKGKPILSCHRCDKFFLDVLSHNAKSANELFKQHRDTFYSEFYGKTNMPFVLPQYNPEQFVDKGGKKNTKHKKEHRENSSYIG